MPSRYIKRHWGKLFAVDTFEKVYDCKAVDDYQLNLLVNGYIREQRRKPNTPNDIIRLCILFGDLKYAVYKVATNDIPMFDDLIGNEQSKHIACYIRCNIPGSDDTEMFRIMLYHERRDGDIAFKISRLPYKMGEKFIKYLIYFEIYCVEAMIMRKGIKWLYPAVHPHMFKNHSAGLIRDCFPKVVWSKYGNLTWKFHVQILKKITGECISSKSDKKFVIPFHMKDSIQYKWNIRKTELQTWILNQKYIRHPFKACHLYSPSFGGCWYLYMQRKRTGFVLRLACYQLPKEVEKVDIEYSIEFCVDDQKIALNPSKRYAVSIKAKSSQNHVAIIPNGNGYYRGYYYNLLNKYFDTDCDMKAVSFKIVINRI